jgi:hypothetical protein
MNITREYLEKQLASLNQQAEQAFATLHGANGAISAVKHLLEVMDRENQPEDVSAEIAASVGSELSS